MGGEPYIEKAKKGDQRAFSHLMDLYWDYVYNYQIKKSVSPIDAEDISIETFTKAFDKIHSYDDKYNFGTWLISISKNIHIDNLRKRRKYFTDEGDSNIKGIMDESPSPEDTLICKQNLNDLLTNIQNLQSPYRDVIKLRFLQEKSYKEMSEITGLSLNNVKVILLRAKKILAKNINLKKK